MKNRFISTMGGTLLLFGICLPLAGRAQPMAAPASAALAARPTQQQSAAEITQIEVKQNPDGQWVAVCEVRVTAVSRQLGLQVDAVAGARPSGNEGPKSSPIPVPLGVGVHRLVFELQRPENYKSEYDPAQNIVLRSHQDVQTNWVVARLMGSIAPGLPPVSILSSRSVEKTIAWPDRRIWTADQEIRKNGPIAVLDRAVALIDDGDEDSLGQARLLLERILLKDGKQTAAYIEMARVVMKSNWGPEGLAQAERFIGSALQLDPKNTNGLILRGYVYAHQKKYKPAEADFSEAAKTSSKNLWLWANWGQLLAMQGKTDAAIVMYAKAVANPVTKDTNDRARLDAYRNLITLYDKGGNLDLMETIYQQRARDYGFRTCYGAEYALFKLQRRGDSAGAIELVKELTQLECGRVNPKEVLGMAYYVDWAKSSGSNQGELLNRARIYFPPSAKLFQRLGGSALTAEAAKRLVKSGESIDQMDNRRMTALAYAIDQRDFDAVRRLIQIGARATTLVGEGEIPVALIPVISNDPQGVRFLRQLGVDYSKIVYRGVPALEYARRTGNPVLTDALSERASKI